MRNESGETIERGSVILDSIPTYKVLDMVVMRHADSTVLFAQTAHFNAVVLSNRLIAMENIAPEEDISVNLAQFVYSQFCALSPTDQQLMYVLADDSVRIAALADGFLPSSGLYTKVVQHNKKHSLLRAMVALKDFTAEDTLFEASGVVVPFPLVNTIALADGKHLRLAGGPEFLQHSCLPSVSITFNGTNIVGTALRDISYGDELTYNFLTTEWDMVLPFKCRCQQSGCYGIIRGFKYLSAEQQAALSSSVSEAILHKWTLNTGSSSSSTVSVFRVLLENERGLIRAIKDIKCGKILLSFKRFIIEKNLLVAENVRIRHSSHANGVLIEGKIVACCTIKRGTEVTVNLNFLAYSFPSFKDEDGVEVRGFEGLNDEDRDKFIMYVEPSIRAEALLNGAVMHSSSSYVTIKAKGEIGQVTVAAVNIAAGTAIFTITGLCLPFPTMYTVSIGKDKHLLFGEGAECLSHSCEPNVRIEVNQETESVKVIAVRDIAVEEVVAFNYLTTEWDMNQPFPCLCGAQHCFRMIKGYKHLSQEKKACLQGLAMSYMAELALGDSLSLPATLQRLDSRIQTTCSVDAGSLLFPCTQFTVHPGHIELFGAVIPHSAEANCVLVESRLVAKRVLRPSELLAVNMSLFLYDLEAFFSPAQLHPLCRGFRHLSQCEQQRELFLCEPSVRAQARMHGFLVRSSNDAVVIRPHQKMGQTAFAARALPADYELLCVSGLVLPFPTMYTVCIGPAKHLLFGDAAECLAHHCEPNVRVTALPDDSLRLETLRAVSPGEMLSFNYLTTEWELHAPFPCLCGANLCCKMVRGFRHLSDSDRRRLWPLTSDYIKTLVNY